MKITGNKIELRPALESDQAEYDDNVFMVKTISEINR